MKRLFPGIYPWKSSLSPWLRVMRPRPFPSVPLRLPPGLPFPGLPLPLLIFVRVFVDVFVSILISIFPIVFLFLSPVFSRRLIRRCDDACRLLLKANEGMARQRGFFASFAQTRPQRLVQLLQVVEVYHELRDGVEPDMARMARHVPVF